MRLIPLSKQQSDIEKFTSMLGDYLTEQGLSSVKQPELKKETEEKLQDQARALFLIESDNKVIGFSEVHLEEECFPDEDLPEICMKMYSFYIKPEFRHQTLGHNAFKLVRQWGRDKKAAIIETEVSRNLDFSNNFLKDQGLELVGTGTRNVWRGFI